MNKQWKFVTSSNIEAVAFVRTEEDNPSGELHIRFRNSRHYVYYGVTEELFNELLNAKSVGVFFHSEIKNKYTYDEIS